MYNIRQVHIHNISNTVIIDIPLCWNFRIACSFSSRFGLRLRGVCNFRWSWASSIWCSAASSLSLFFVISVSSIISGWFILKTIWIYRIMCTFHFFTWNAFVVLIFAIFTFSLIFASGRTSANRWSLRPFWRCEIWVFSFRFGSR